MIAPLDDLDRRVIGELQHDGRRAFREIARTLGVSEATVRARVRRLERSGALRIVAFADPSALGHRRLALTLITIAAGSHDDVIETLVALPEVGYVSTILGPADVCAQVLVADDRALSEFVTGVLRAIPGVTDVQTVCDPVDLVSCRIDSVSRLRRLGVRGSTRRLAHASVHALRSRAAPRTPSQHTHAARISATGH